MQRIKHMLILNFLPAAGWIEILGAQPKLHLLVLVYLTKLGLPRGSTRIDRDDDTVSSNHEFPKARRKPPGFDCKRMISNFLGVNNNCEFGISFDEVSHNSGDHKNLQKEVQRNHGEFF